MKRQLLIAINLLFIFISCKNEIIEVEKIDSTSPQQIYNVSAIGSNNTILLSWTNPNDNDFYGTRITFSPNAKSVTQPIIIEGEAEKTSQAFINGLENGTDYTFTLIALDKSQNRSEQVTLKATPISNADIIAPSEVSSLTSMSGNSTIIFSWANPSDSDFYAVEISSNPAEGTLSQNVILTGNPSENMTFTVSNLENAKEYNFTFKTIDKSLNKSSGNNIYASPTDNNDYTAPAEVSDFSITSGNSTAVLSWTNPSDSDFYAVEISSNPAEGTLSQNVILTGNPSANMNFTVSNLENAKEYDFTIKTIDKSLNISDGSLKTISPTDDGDYIPPANVTNLSAINKGNSILLTWTDATDSDIFGYEVSYNGKDETRSAFVIPLEAYSVMVAQGTEFFLVQNLTNEKEYIFTVKSVDTSGNKSNGTSIYATPHESKLSINIGLPNDDGENIILTNDKAPVNVNFSSTDSIAKAVWKKGEKNIGVKPEELLVDTTANIISTDKTSSSIFYVTENGWYNVVAKDSVGRFDWEQIEIKTIDRIPLADIKNFKAYSDGENINITYEDSICINEYDSPLNTVRLSFIYNDDETDPNNGTIYVDAGKQNCIIPIAKEEPDGSYMHITAQTVDKLGNCSQGITVMSWCSKTIVATKNDVIEKISSMSESGKVIILGESDDELMSNLKIALQSNTSVEVILDLSKVTNMKKIDTNAFMECNSLCEIILPECITEIGKNAFAQCTNLKTIQLPDSITSIKQEAFAYCKKLSKINIPNNIQEIGAWAFTGCQSIESIIIPETITTLSTGTFRGCYNMKSIIIPNTVSSIEAECFYGCSSLTNIELPKELTNISEYVFKYCSNIKAIKLPESVISIKLEAFQYCESLSSIELPSTITLIADSAFFGCEQLTNIILPESLKEIGNNSFSKCNSLKSIIIPNSVEIIGNSAFSNCENLEIVELPFGITNIAQYTFNECKKLKTINIPNTVTSIDKYAFNNCISLENLTIPNGVISIGKRAFYNCQSMTELSIPNSINYIEEDAFRSCIGLSKLSIYCNASAIHSSAFKYCIELLDITIPNLYSIKNTFYTDSNSTSLEIKIETVTILSGTSISSPIFDDCTKITTINLPNTITTIGNSAFSGCKKLTNITIPENVNSIGSSAFSQCESITNLKLPNSVTEIGEHAFNQCKGLNTITIPEGVEVIENGTFSYCENLSNISIPSTLKTIGNYAFSNCKKLEEFSMTNTVETIGDYAFSDCENLTFQDFPNSIKTIGNRAFQNCKKIEDLYIPEGITTIGNEAFEGCENLININIPNSIKVLQEGLFSGCKNLESVTISEGVSSIEAYVFSRCDKLATITIPKTVTLIHSRALFSMDYETNPKNLIFEDTTSNWYIKYTSASEGELLGSMSATDTQSNATLFRQKALYSDVYLYNEKHIFE